MKRPNILWICSDQQRFDTLGCYGNKFVKTPNLDRLAGSGMLFEKCFVQNPVCTPSRSSFLTGRYPRTTCCRQNGQSIPQREKLITKVFSDAGYLCGLAGKLHLSACAPTHRKGKTEVRIDDGYDIFNWSHDSHLDEPINQYFMWLREVGYDFKKQTSKHSKQVNVGPPACYHQTTWCTNKAIDFIESSCGSENPWMLSINYFDPHAPFDPPEEYLNRYLNIINEIPAPNYVEGELENKPYMQKLEHEEATNSSSLNTSYQASNISREDHLYIRAAYWAMIDLIDDQVGRLMDFLEKKQLLENTIVIFMSDHGELLGDHGMYYKGPYFYDPALRVPFIVSWPDKILPNARSNALVELVDLAPTLLDAAGIPHPDGMQGKSIWGMLTGNSDINYHKDNVYCEFYNSLRNKPHVHATMVRSQHHKLVVYHGSDMELGELYDMEKDPNETYNQWDNPQYAGIKMKMMKALCDRMAFTVDPLPARTGHW